MPNPKFESSQDWCDHLLIQHAINQTSDTLIRQVYFWEPSTLSTIPPRCSSYPSNPNQMGSSASKPPKITPKDKAILDLKVQRDKLKKYQTQLESVRERETQVAQECLRRGDKKRALLALKKKKYQDSLLEKTDNQLMKLEELVRSTRLIHQLSNTRWTLTLSFATDIDDWIRSRGTGIR